MEPITWSVLCCILMVVATVMEALTPSVGFFTCLAVGLAAASVWLGFRQSAPMGYTMLGVNVVLFPAALAVTIHFLKHSPLLLHKVVVAGVPREPVAPQPAHALLGQEGQALTTLRPAGTAVFGDRRVDVVTDGKFVEAGRKVKVIKVSGTIVVVEPIE
jgi:membrane-bound serine protease (ClpP class)